MGLNEKRPHSYRDIGRHDRSLVTLIKQPLDHVAKALEANTAICRYGHA
jgi:hypothetical protein